MQLISCGLRPYRSEDGRPCMGYAAGRGVTVGGSSLAVNSCRKMVKYNYLGQRVGMKRDSSRASLHDSFSQNVVESLSN